LENNNNKGVLLLFMMPKLVLIFSIVCGALGQIFFKIGINKIQSGGFEFYLSAVKNLWVMAGFFSYGISFLLWIYILKFFDISYARPLTGAGYILTYAMAIIFIGESLTAKRLIATLIITVGVLLME
jgi:multidrug transporter EmrE-like cation transporter